MNKTTFGIEGMHCSSCAFRIEKSLSSINGVQSAVVNFPLESATVEFDEKSVKEDELHNAVIKEGYKVKMKTSEHSGEHEGHMAHEEGKKEGKLAVIAFIFGLPALLLAMLEIEISGEGG